MPIEFKCETRKNEKGEDEISIAIHCDRDYFNKDNNEPLIMEIMSHYIKGNWERIEQQNHEHDLKCNGSEYECILAVDEELALGTKNCTYQTNKLLQENSRLIIEAAQKKADKKYADKPSLCILSLIYNLFWRGHEKEANEEDPYVLYAQNCYNKLKENYIDTEIFENIYVIYPIGDIYWALVDIKNRTYLSPIIPLNGV